MPPTESRFSTRYDYTEPEKEISVREDASRRLRGAIIQIAKERGLQPSTLRDILCRVLREMPDANNWSEYPNIDYEAGQLIQNCEWFYVYDISEQIYSVLLHKGEANQFEHDLNSYFRKEGIGWQMVGGIIETRGTESFQSAVRSAVDALGNSNRATASNEIHEALRDLSRRPEADLTGAIQHAMAALECVARDICEDKATLGDILKRYPDLLPKPIDDCVSKAWGYASEMARHLREGRTPTREEAELIVGLSSVVASYLAGKSKTAQ
jgi:hypothetical protein